MANALRLLKLPPALQGYIREGRLSVGHAKVLLGLATDKQQKAVAERVLKEGLNVRQAEAQIAANREGIAADIAADIRQHDDRRLGVEAIDLLSPRKVLHPAAVLPRPSRDLPELYGVAPVYSQIHSLRLAEGKFFDQSDDAASASVCVLGEGAKVGIFGYGGASVKSGLGGTLTGQNLAPISALANNPIRVEQRKRQVDDGAGGLIEQSVRFPVWFEPAANGTPNSCSQSFAPSMMSTVLAGLVRSQRHVPAWRSSCPAPDSSAPPCSCSSRSRPGGPATRPRR